MCFTCFSGRSARSSGNDPPGGVHRISLQSATATSEADAAAEGDRNTATNLTVRARDLVGDEACKALIKLMRESDAEMAEAADDASEGDGADA